MVRWRRTKLNKTARPGAGTMFRRPARPESRRAALRRQPKTPESSMHNDTVISDAMPLVGTSAGQLRAMFSQAAVGIAIADESGRFIEANEKARSMLGCTLEQLRGRTFLELTHPDDQLRTREAVQRLRAGAISSYSLEKRYLRCDGGIVWTNTTVTLLPADDDQPRCFFGILQPLDDRRANEEMKSRLAAVVDSSDDAIITKTLDGRIETEHVVDASLRLVKGGNVVGDSRADTMAKWSVGAGPQPAAPQPAAPARAAMAGRSRIATQRARGPGRLEKSIACTPRSNATHAITFEWMNWRVGPRTSQMP